MQKNQNGTARLAVSLRELANQGSSVDLSVAGTKKDEPTGIEIEQVGGILESSIFELPGGLTGYMVRVAVTNQTSQTIRKRQSKHKIGRLRIRSQRAFAL